MTSSLIIATYNRPDALALVLESVLLQTQMPGEVLIADDGSEAATKSVVKAYAEKISIPLHHIWHEDKGFRLSAIRNKAIAAAKGDYIIQVDGDVIMHPHFIEDHIAFARENSFVRASRIYLDEALTAKKLQEKNAHINVWKSGVSNKTSALHVPLLWPFFETGYKNKGLERFEIHGCNMAFWRSDAIRTNGYNEDFEGWGYEDKEFVARLLAVGCVKRFLKLGGIVFHLHHPESPRDRESINALILNQSIEQPSTRCANGIDKYLTT